MASHHEEMQEIENVKYLWKKGGKYLVGLLVVAALGYLGHNVYLGQVQKGNAAAALQASQVQGDTAKLATLQQQHQNSPATVQATLETAKTLFDAGKLPEAETAYRWVLEHKPAPIFQVAAMQNLANVLLQQKKYDEALKVLYMPVDTAFASIINESKGDVFAAQGKTKEAKDAYQATLDKLPENSPSRELVQLKMEQL